MKDKKRVLKILAILIAVITLILGIVLIFGTIKDKQVKSFYKKMEDTACKYVKEENLTPELCEAYPHLCKIKIKTLIEREKIDESKKSPINNKQLRDSDSYIQVSWKNDEMMCEYKEG